MGRWFLSIWRYSQQNQSFNRYAGYVGVFPFHGMLTMLGTKEVSILFLVKQSILTSVYPLIPLYCEFVKCRWSKLQAFSKRDASEKFCFVDADPSDPLNRIPVGFYCHYKVPIESYTYSNRSTPWIIVTWIYFQDAFWFFFINSFVILTFCFFHSTLTYSL